jgi:POT family proton-dependent oligopeptide transporter
MAHPQTDSEKEPVSSSEAVSDIESTLPRDATDEEVHTLPKVVDRIPIAAWAAALVGAAERFSYYSTISIWREMPSLADIVNSITNNDHRKLHAE